MPLKIKFYSPQEEANCYISDLNINIFLTGKASYSINTKTGMIIKGSSPNKPAFYKGNAVGFLEPHAEMDYESKLNENIEFTYDYLYY